LAVALAWGALALGQETQSADDVAMIDPLTDPAEDLANAATILPTTEHEKDAKFGREFHLTTFASKDCSGAAMGNKKVDACADANDIKMCPDKMWTEGFECVETEKDGDTAYTQKWKWGVYQNKLMMRLYDDDDSWKSLSEGKAVGAAAVATCFNSEDDIRNVFLLNKVNTPTCKPVTSYGVGESAAEAEGDKAGFIPILGSFTLVPTSPTAYGPEMKSKDMQKPEHMVKPDTKTGGTYDWPDKK
jgi:hypothetical protein